MGHLMVETPSDVVAHIPPLQGTSIARASDDAVKEIARQDKLARAGHFGKLHTLPGGPDDARLGVLVEEVGEIARELNEMRIGSRSDRDYLYGELVQTAASAIAWAAAILEDR